MCPNASLWGSVHMKMTSSYTTLKFQLVWTRHVPPHWKIPGNTPGAG